MAGAGSFRDRLVARLKYLIELRGMSVARVEQELGRSRGFLGDALRGDKRLPVETILEVLDLLQVDPARFFAGARPGRRGWGRYAPDRSSRTSVADDSVEDPLRRIRDNLGDGSIEIEAVARVLRAVVRLLDEKGYLRREELASALSSGGRSGSR